jgi:hypothetical protein
MVTEASFSKEFNIQLGITMLPMMAQPMVAIYNLPGLTTPLVRAPPS